MLNSFKKLTILFALVLGAFNAVSCLPTLEGVNVSLAGQQVRLTLLHTSDIHSRLLPYDFNPLKTDTDLGLIPEAGPFGGATRMATLIKRERQKSDRVLHLDSGDSFQGAPVFNLNLGEVEYKFLSLIGVDAAVIGNHEFDAGAANFTKQARESARFPLLAANYYWEDYNQPVSNATTFFTAPYTIKNIGGLRVGIIGMANVSSLNSIAEQGNSLQAIPLEQNEAARSYVELLRGSTDLIVVTSHAGLTEDQELVGGYEAFYEWKLARKFVGREIWPWKIIEWFGPEGKDESVVRVRIPGVEGIDAILGGHLHIVLNPPQILTDPSGRRVILSHGGAFSKYVNRIDAVVQVPKKGDDYNGAEITSFDFKVFPIDSLWCSDALHDYYKSQFFNAGDFIKQKAVQDGIAQCKELEDRNTLQLLLPYINDLDVKLNLTSLFAFAPGDIARRNNSSGGDSPLGNIATDSMRRRQGVEAEVAITNSLGIRDNLYAGALTQEAMFNVFPFENTVNIMFLSGREMQEMFDFITERSSSRGCTAQSQVSGARFTMDCAQAQLNALRVSCDPAKNGSDCPNDDRSGGRFAWQCLQDNQTGGGRCWSHPGTNITVTGKPLNENETYRVAVNDFIARGGSGFLVLKRNTTRVETGIPLRDSLIGYMQNFCSCDEILADKRDSSGVLIGAKNQPCGLRDPTDPTKWIVDAQVRSFCADSKSFVDALNEPRFEGCSCKAVFEKTCAAPGVGPEQLKACTQLVSSGPNLGRCRCREALQQDPLCGNVTRAVKNFCENPLQLPVAVGTEDNRISRRVK
jgi:5'-nucleotidase / UDP-sugar diphosphatase